MKPVLSTIAIAGYYCLFLLVGGYFAFAAVQGNSGRFARTAIMDKEAVLIRELTNLHSEVDKMSNLVRRLSDGYLDIELLDERARTVLGYVRDDEIIVY